jgi:Domain of unknown function (DUF4159)
MRAGTRPMLLALTVALAVILVAPCRPASAQVTDDKIEAAIEKGVKYFFDLQTDQGWFSGKGIYSKRYIGGDEVCAMLALAYAGVPISDPRMEKGFKALLKFDMRHTYTRSLRIMVIAKMLPKLRRELASRARKVMKADAAFLVEIQHDSGGWGYPAYLPNTDPPERNPRDTWQDFSNTQIAILGLSEASRSGIEIPSAVYKKTLDLYLKEQFPDGGWDYLHEFGGTNVHRDRPYGSMTAAAVASLFLIRDIVYPGMGCPCKGGRSSGRVPRLDKVIDDGLGWLGKHFSGREHPSVHPGGAKRLSGWFHYWLYSCERAGLASGIKYFGTHDWYAEGAARLLRLQRRDGGWGRTNLSCWAICFLVKGRAPILMNKLKFDGLWHSHSRDCAHLAKYFGKLKEQAFQWQIITTDAPVAEWHDAPILYISAESTLTFSAGEKTKLREFTDTGGTILFEASCGNRAAKKAWEKLLAELWPEFELKQIDKAHPLWTADTEIKGRVPRLLGMHDGVRTFMFVSWHDISCAWHRWSVTRRKPLFDLAGNLFAYATDRRRLRARLARRRVMTRDRYLGAKLSAGERSELKLSRVTHGGDWYLGRNYKLLARLAASVSEQTPMTLSVAEPAAPSHLAEAGVNVAVLMGSKSVRLDTAESAALKAWLAAGGLLVAEAVLGGREFDTEFRNLAGQMGLRLKPIAPTDPLLTGQMGGAAGYAIDTARFKFALRAERIGRSVPELYGLYLGDKPVGVYSPFGLSYCRTWQDAFGCRGYEAEDATALWTNILLWASSR